MNSWQHHHLDGKTTTLITTQLSWWQHNWIDSTTVLTDTTVTTNHLDDNSLNILDDNKTELMTTQTPWWQYNYLDDNTTYYIDGNTATLMTNTLATQLHWWQHKHLDDNTTELMTIQLLWWQYTTTLKTIHKTKSPWWQYRLLLYIGGQTSSPYWGTNRQPLLGDKQVDLIGGQTGSATGGQTGWPYWGTNTLATQLHWWQYKHLDDNTTELMTIQLQHNYLDNNNCLDNSQPRWWQHYY